MNILIGSHFNKIIFDMFQGINGNLLLFFIKWATWSEPNELIYQRRSEFLKKCFAPILSFVNPHSNKSSSFILCFIVNFLEVKTRPFFRGEDRKISCSLHKLHAPFSHFPPSEIPDSQCLKFSMMYTYFLGFPCFVYGFQISKVFTIKCPNFQTIDNLSYFVLFLYIHASLPDFPLIQMQFQLLEIIYKINKTKSTTLNLVMVLFNLLMKNPARTCNQFDEYCKEQVHFLEILMKNCKHSQSCIDHLGRVETMEPLPVIKKCAHL